MARTLREVRTDSAPRPVGPYSQALVAGGLVFASGQIPLDPATGRLVEGDAAAQAERVLANLQAVLEAAGSSLARTVRVTVYLADLGDFPAVNGAYARHFASEPRPARTTIQAARLPLGAAVEIDAIALAGGARRARGRSRSAAAPSAPRGRRRTRGRAGSGSRR